MLDGVFPRAGLWLGMTSFGIGEPAPFELLSGNAAEIGLDIKNGRAVEHIDASHH